MQVRAPALGLIAGMRPWVRGSSDLLMDTVAGAPQGHEPTLIPASGYLLAHEGVGSRGLSRVTSLHVLPAHFGHPQPSYPASLPLSCFLTFTSEWILEGQSWKELQLSFPMFSFSAAGMEAQRGEVTVQGHMARLWLSWTHLPT